MSYRTKHERLTAPSFDSPELEAAYFKLLNAARPTADSIYKEVGTIMSTDGSAPILADPNELEGVCIGYRFGRTPELFVASDPLMGSMFTNDEMRIKVRFVYALGIGDYRAMHKNNVS